MSYVKTSTHNPLGWRPLNSRINAHGAPAGMPGGFNLTPANAPDFTPPAAASNLTLKGYYPANYFVPTAGNIHGPAVANVLGDYFPNYPSLRPTSIATRDDRYSPVPRIYLPPEDIPIPQLGDLGAAVRASRAHRAAAKANPHQAVWDKIQSRRNFSGGVHVANPDAAQGVFYPATPHAPNQFKLQAGPGVYAPNPATPTGYYYPRTPTRVPVPAALRVMAGSWDSIATRHHALDGLGAVNVVRSFVPARSSVVPVTLGPPTGLLKWGPVGPASPIAPIVISPPGPGFWGSPAPVRAPARPPNTVTTGPTYPPGTMPIGGGSCQVTSTPETGGVVSVVPCSGVPGYSPGGTTTASGQRGRRQWPWPGGQNNQSSAAYQSAMAAAQNGTLTSAMLTGLSSSQQQQVMAAYQSSSAAQQAALQAGGSSAAVPAAADTTASSDGYQSILDWLSEQTLISGMPNWVIAGGGVLAGIWLMNRGKK